MKMHPLSIASAVAGAFGFTPWHPSKKVRAKISAPMGIKARKRAKNKAAREARRINRRNAK
jgi:hypothetical protein